MLRLVIQYLSLGLFLITITSCNMLSNNDEFIYQTGSINLGIIGRTGSIEVILSGDTPFDRSKLVPSLKGKDLGKYIGIISNQYHIIWGAQGSFTGILEKIIDYPGIRIISIQNSNMFTIEYDDSNADAIRSIEELKKEFSNDSPYTIMQSSFVGQDVDININ